MPRMIIVDAAEEIACPKCAYAFALSDGISRQAIERHAEAFDRSLADRTKALEAELAAEAKRRAEREAKQAREAFQLELKSATEALAAKEIRTQRSSPNAVPGTKARPCSSRSQSQRRSTSANFEPRLSNCDTSGNA